MLQAEHTTTMSKHQITDAESAAALPVGRAEAKTEIRAQVVRNARDHDAIEIMTPGYAGFLIP